MTVKNVIQSSDTGFHRKKGEDKIMLFSVKEVKVSILLI